MSAATISINKKLNDGTLISVGGVSYDDFVANLIAALADTAEYNPAVNAVLGEIRSVLLPVGADFAQAAANVQNAGLAAPAPQVPPQQYAPQNAPQQGYNGQYQQAPQQHQARQPAGPPPGLTAPFCPHGQRVWYTGKSRANNTPFNAWKCPSQDRNNRCEGFDFTGIPRGR